MRTIASIPFYHLRAPPQRTCSSPWVNHDVEMVIEQGFPATVGTPDRRMYDHWVGGWVSVSMDVCRCVGVCVCACVCVRCVGMFVRSVWVCAYESVCVCVCVCVCEVCGVGWGGCECEVWGCEACVSVHTCMC